MKISVVITVFNLERFVKLSIESVLNQTRKADEIFVVDDGSTDRSVEIIQSFGQQVQLIRMEKNSGVLPAFIEGLKKCTGEILTFLDGDDIWMPQKLEKVERIYEQDPDVMMVTHLHQWMDLEGVPSDKMDETHRNLRRIVKTTDNLHARDSLLKNSILCYKGVWLGSAFTIRRSCLNLPSFIEWAASLPGIELSHQDQPLAAFMIYTIPDKRIHFINEALFQYRVYATNSSGSSMNLPSALKTLNRSIATVSRTRNIVEKMPERKEENFHQEMKLLELQFIQELYTRKNMQAVKHFNRLFFSYWSGSKKLKETQRLVACLFLGPEKFLKMKAKRFQ